MPLSIYFWKIWSNLKTIWYSWEAFVRGSRNVLKTNSGALHKSFSSHFEVKYKPYELAFEGVLIKEMICVKTLRKSSGIISMLLIFREKFLIIGATFFQIAIILMLWSFILEKIFQKNEKINKKILFFFYFKKFRLIFLHFSMKNEIFTNNWEIGGLFNHGMKSETRDILFLFERSMNGSIFTFCRAFITAWTIINFDVIKSGVNIGGI